MIEQEMASIIKYVAEKAGGPSPYYWNVPQNFTIPAVHFPVPEISSGGETFSTYYLDYVWYIKFFHRTEQGAYAMGQTVLNSIRAARNLIPLIEEQGNEIPGEWVRVDDPSLKVVDDGAAQLTINWRSRRPYDDTIAPRTKASSFDLNMFMKSGETISDEYARALEKYAIPTNQPG